jgi:2-polyprenyl-3-methyl-5-hydroxy-6-metoxy-1,4-benzoquinol methylase
MSIQYDLETVNCLCCGSDSYEPYLKAKDLITHTGEIFTVVKCQVCGLKWTNPRPKVSDLGRFYPESYQPYAITKATVTYGSPKKWSLRNVLVSGYHIPKNNYWEKDVLELGCSSGAFLKKLQEMGAQVQGIEFSDYAANLAREKGLDVVTGTLDTYNTKKKFDFIFAWMVIEHLYDPKKSLEQIKNLLKPDGLFIFSVPNIGSLDFYLFKKNWFALQVPTHTIHFDKHSIVHVLSTAGLDIVLKVDQLSSSNYIFSLQNLFNENGITKCDWFFNGLIYKKWGMPIRRGLDLLARLIGQSGRITVWAKAS